MRLADYGHRWRIKTRNYCLIGIECGPKWTIELLSQKYPQADKIFYAIHGEIERYYRKDRQVWMDISI